MAARCFLINEKGKDKIKAVSKNKTDKLYSNAPSQRLNMIKHKSSHASMARAFTIKEQDGLKLLNRSRSIRKIEEDHLARSGTEY